MKPPTVVDRTFRESFEVASGKYVTLTDSTMRDLELASTGMWAVGRDTRAYVSDYKRPMADIYRVNTSTGERTLMLKEQLTSGAVFGISPDGHKYLYWKDDKYQAYDLDAGTSKTLGTGSNASFVDMEYDHPGPKPSYGVAGYTPDGSGVIVNCTSLAIAAVTIAPPPLYGTCVKSMPALSANMTQAR